MMSYEEMAKNVLEQRDKQLEARRKKLIITERCVSIAACFCFTVILGIQLFQKMQSVPREDFMEKTTDTSVSSGISEETYGTTVKGSAVYTENTASQTTTAPVSVSAGTVTKNTGKNHFVSSEPGHTQNTSSYVQTTPADKTSPANTSGTITASQTKKTSASKTRPSVTSMTSVSKTCTASDGVYNTTLSSAVNSSAGESSVSASMVTTTINDEETTKKLTTSTNHKDSSDDEYVLPQEKYLYVTIDDITYSSFAIEVDDKLIEKKLGDAIAKRTFDGSGDSKKVEYFKIKDITDSCFIAVRFENDTKYYAYKNGRYKANTLGEIMDDLGVNNADSFGYISDYLDAPIKIDDYDREVLLQLLNEYRDCYKILDSTRSHYGRLLFKINFKIPGALDGINVTRDGYIKSGIIGWEYVIYIGKDRAQKFSEDLGIDFIDKKID